jgi:hypothetical protein
MVCAVTVKTVVNLYKEMGPLNISVHSQKFYLLCDLALLAHLVSKVLFLKYGTTDVQSACECEPPFYPRELFFVHYISTGACRNGGWSGVGVEWGRKSEKISVWSIFGQNVHPQVLESCIGSMYTTPSSG